MELNQFALHLASENGDIETVKCLVENKCDINAPYFNNWTALHIASEKGHLEVVKYLVQSKSDINAVNNNNSTALHIASQNGHLQIVKFLVDSKSDINALAEDNWTALHFASQNGHLEVVMLLVEKKCNINGVNNNNSTALHIASQNFHFQIVKFLVESKCNMNAMNNNNSTALHIASENDQLQAVKFLVESKCDINAVDNDNWTALHIATYNDHLKVVMFLVESKCNINAVEKNNWTALHIASEQGHLEVVKFLTESKSDINAVTNYNSTALHFATHNGHLEVVMFLVESKCNLNAMNNSNSTALHIASQNGHLQIIKFLVESKCDINTMPKRNYTALHIASQNGHLGVVKFLLDNSVNINELSYDNQTALHIASAEGHLNIVKCLLEHQCDIYARDEDNRTALHWAAHRGHAEVIQILIGIGISDDTEDFFGRTPLYLSAKHDNFIGLKVCFSKSAYKFSQQQLRIALRLNDGEVIINLVEFAKFSALEWISAIVEGSSNTLLRNETFTNYLLPKLSEDQAFARPLLQNQNTCAMLFELACKYNVISVVKYLAKAAAIDINRGKYTPVWHVSNRGHGDVMKFLVKIFGATMNFKAATPDGTTPLIISIAKEHKELIPHFRELYQDDMEIISVCQTFGRQDIIKNFFGSDMVFGKDDIVKSFHGISNPGHFPLVRLSKKFPIFNKNIEISWTNNIVPHHGSYHNMGCKQFVSVINHLEKNVLRRFCCVPIGEKVIKISSATLKCETDCKQADKCQIVQNVCKMISQLEKELKGANEAMRFLQPELYLIGSLAEGTRIGKVTEADVTMRFSGLQKFPLRMGKSATELLLPQDGVAFNYLKQFCIRGTQDAFDYPKFLGFLLTTIDSCMKIIDMSDCGLKVKRWNGDYIPCKDCIIASEQMRTENSSIIFDCQANTHCVKCLPAITHTKLGPCLILKSKFSSSIITIDLIPVFTVDESDPMEIHRNVIQTLVEDRPINWLQYFNTVINTDAILPEYGDTADREKLRHNLTSEITIKLLHHGPTPNYIIRPGQEMEIELFQKSTLLKKIYTCMKGLRDILNVDAKSYVMKKIILLPEFKEKVSDISQKHETESMLERHSGTVTKSVGGRYFDSADTWKRNANFAQLLFDAMSNPDLKRSFDKSINYEYWQDTISLMYSDVIPLQDDWAPLVEKP